MRSIDALNSRLQLSDSRSGETMLKSAEPQSEALPKGKAKSVHANSESLFQQQLGNQASSRSSSAGANWLTTG